MIVIPVAFCFDSRIIMASSIAIKSLIDNAKDNTIYDIRVFHSDLSLELQKNITTLIEGTRHNIGFHYINPQEFKNAPHNNHSWTEIVYYRFLAPRIMPEYDKVIYSDVDVLFKGDLQELFLTDISEYEIAAVRCEKMNKKYLQECTNEYIHYSGLIMFNTKKFREENILNKLQENIILHGDKLKFFDFDLMNITCKNIYPIPFKYCVLQSLLRVEDIKDAREYPAMSSVYSDDEILDGYKNAVIIHYAGRPGKPWHFKKPYDDYKEYMQKLPKNLRIVTFRDFRKKLFSKV